jgi:hypothetical protein
MNAFAKEVGSEASTYQQEPLYTTEQRLLRARLDQERRLWEHKEQLLKLQIQRRRTRKLQKVRVPCILHSEDGFSAERCLIAFVLPLLGTTALRTHYTHEKISMFVLSSLALIETIILVTTIVKPYPQFSLSGNLLYIQSITADQYSKRANYFMRRDFTPLGLSQADKNLDEVAAAGSYTDQSRFVAFWLGTMGVCLQRA